MNESSSEKNSNFFKSVITIILTIIAVLASLITISLSRVLTNQEEVGKELVRMKTIQDENTLKINTHMNKPDIELLKNWVDDNYIRKPQK